MTCTQKLGLAEPCRDPRLNAVAFRALHFLASRTAADGVVEVTPKVLEEGARVKQSAFTGTLAGLINCGYAEPAGPTDRLPYRLRLRLQNATGKPKRNDKGRRLRLGDGYRLLLATVVELAGADSDRPLAWSAVKAKFLADHARAGDEAAQADSLRRRVARYRDQLVLQGTLVVQGRAVRLLREDAKR